MPVVHQKKVAPKLTPTQRLIEEFIEEESMSKDPWRHYQNRMHEALRIPDLSQSMAELSEVNTAYMKWQFEKVMQDNLHYLVYPESFLCAWI